MKDKEMTAEDILEEVRREDEKKRVN